MRGMVRCDLGHGAQPPRGWRLAWYEPRRRVGVFFPAPLHWLARGLRELAWRMGVAWRAPTREKHDVFDLQRVYRERQKLAGEYSRGYLQGWQECFDTWVETIDTVSDDDETAELTETRKNERRKRPSKFARRKAQARKRSGA